MNFSLKFATSLLLTFLTVQCLATVNVQFTVNNYYDNPFLSYKVTATYSGGPNIAATKITGHKMKNNSPLTHQGPQFSFGIGYDKILITAVKFAYTLDGVNFKHCSFTYRLPLAHPLLMSSSYIVSGSSQVIGFYKLPGGVYSLLGQYPHAKFANCKVTLYSNDCAMPTDTQFCRNLNVYIYAD